MVLKSSVPASPKSMVPSSVNAPSSRICTLDVKDACSPGASSMESCGPPASSAVESRAVAEPVRAASSPSLPSFGPADPLNCMA